MKKVNVKVNFHNIIWGIVLVAAGVIFALNSLKITNIDIFFEGWWTLFIILPCAIGLVTSRDKGGNAAGLVIGVFLLLCARGILEYSMIWKLLLPAFVVAIGLKMFFGGLFGGRKKEKEWKNFNEEIEAELNAAFDDDDDDDDDDEPESETATGDSHYESTIFSFHRVNYDNRAFRVAKLNVIFGGTQFDLRKAIINEDCKISTNCIFGGVTILVPENVNVKVLGNGVFGGVSDKTTHHKGAPTIYIHNNTIFGGITVKE